ncbi:MAG: methyltransferase domain-containing protein [Alphaproteobacteria bacterium]
MLYGEDLAHIQAAGFDGFATRVAPALVALLRAAAIAVERVCDVGCGAGTTTRALCDAGFAVTAIEPSAPLLALARAAAPGARFVNASVYGAALPAAEAVVALGEPLTYHQPDDDAGARLRAVFAAAARALPPEGLLVFDLLTPDAAGPVRRGWQSGVDWAVLYEVRPGAQPDRLERSIETFRMVGGGYRRGRERHHVRLFQVGDVVAWLDGAGFAVDVRDRLGDAPLPEGRRLFVAVRRPAQLARRSTRSGPAG